ncbi:hypothetical protein [uncultured Helicobacter sp.]|uniref:hypothetical protein n=1 Tax=uncultured Helicobacter sp. TaxID=175537 RepID=UPI0037513D62
MLLAGNCVIYLKEVSFILISGFGFLHLLFSFLSHHKSFKSLDKRLISMDIALMISGVVFLLCYVYATANAHASYTNQEFVFSPHTHARCLCASRPDGECRAAMYAASARCVA